MSLFSFVHNQSTVILFRHCNFLYSCILFITIFLLSGTVCCSSVRVVNYTARHDGNRLLHFMVVAILDPATPGVQSSAVLAMAQLLSVGDDAARARYKGLFLQSAAALEAQVVLSHNMLAELAAVHMPTHQCLRWTLTVTFSSHMSRNFMIS